MSVRDEAVRLAVRRRADGSGPAYLFRGFQARQGFRIIRRVGGEPAARFVAADDDAGEGSLALVHDGVGFDYGAALRPLDDLGMGQGVDLALQDPGILALEGLVRPLRRIDPGRLL